MRREENDAGIGGTKRPWRPYWPCRIRKASCGRGLPSIGCGNKRRDKVTRRRPARCSQPNRSSSPDSATAPEGVGNDGLWKALRSSHRPWKSLSRFPHSHRMATARLTSNPPRKELSSVTPPYLFSRLILRLEKTPEDRQIDDVDILICSIPGSPSDSTGV